MKASFTDLVGTAVVPAPRLDRAELTDLAPALEMATAIRDMSSQASQALNGPDGANSMTVLRC